MLEKRLLGKSFLNKDIELFSLSFGGHRNVLLLGGVHGDELEAVYIAERFLDFNEIKKLNGLLNVYLLPKLNPDGCALKTRQNARDVDLNRNMPTKDWFPEALKPKYNPGTFASSEVETNILINLIEEIKPVCIISFHCYEPMINYNGPCKRLAEKMSIYNSYKVVSDIGYPTPGSLGTWAGIERNIPVITLEIERGCGNDIAWNLNKNAIFEGLKFIAENDEL